MPECRVQLFCEEFSKNFFYTLMA